MLWLAALAALMPRLARADERVAEVATLRGGVAVGPTCILPSVLDPTRVKPILFNVLANAAKFTEEGRVITVRGRALPEADVIAVQDPGIGIAPADPERVFQRLAHVHKGDTRKYGGTGLGLPLSRSLARMHGGDLTVESTAQGSTFTLTLPRRAPVRRASTRNPGAAE
ncbi:MAG: ATP-binding protein [Polyangiales bacterium]